MIRHITTYRQVLAPAMALCLLLIAAAFLAGCTNGDSTATTERPQPTATSTSAPDTATATPSGTEPAGETAAPSRPPIQVVATSNIVADWAEVIGGDRVEVFSLVPPGGDPHSFVPGAQDVAKVADADIVFSIGLGLEVDWLEDLVRNARTDDSGIFALGDGVDPLEFSGGDDHDDGAEHMDDHEDDHDDGAEHMDDHEDDHDDGAEHMDDHDDDHDGHGHGPLDPHFWFDPNRVKIAAIAIAAQLSAIDRESASFYFQNAADYAMQLDELHSWTQEQVGLVEPERRLLVTSHDTFAYFADVYGFEVIGALIPSLAPDAEPSAEHIAGLVEVIREHNVPAVFSETTVSEKVPEALARETGAELIQLYADSLGEKDSAAGTYLGMVRTNVERIVDGLR